MIRTYEASVLSVEPRGDHQVATVRVQGLGTLSVEVPLGHVGDGVMTGDVRVLTIETKLWQLIGHDEQPADHR
jgi:hypothetical protein